MVYSWSDLERRVLSDGVLSRRGEASRMMECMNFCDCASEDWSDISTIFSRRDAGYAPVYSAVR